MTTFRFTISFCILASLLLIASSQTLSCSDTNPDREQICTLIYAPVCADYPIQCFVPPCPQVNPFAAGSPRLWDIPQERVKDFGNACQACADPIVQTYTNGPCPVDDTEGELGEGEGEGEFGEGEWNEEGWLDGRTVCNNPPGVLVLCAQIYEPVCGYFNGQDDGTTYGNACLACYQGNVDYHLPGACPGDEDFEWIF